MSAELILVEFKRFRELQDAELLLHALEQHGADNWEGYGDAMETYNEWVKEDE